MEKSKKDFVWFLTVASIGMSLLPFIGIFIMLSMDAQIKDLGTMAMFFIYFILFGPWILSVSFALLTLIYGSMSRMKDIQVKSIIALSISGIVLLIMIGLFLSYLM